VTLESEPPHLGKVKGTGWSYRCQECGFLDFYADPKFAAQ